MRLEEKWRFDRHREHYARSGHTLAQSGSDQTATGNAMPEVENSGDFTATNFIFYKKLIHFLDNIDFAYNF